MVVPAREEQDIALVQADPDLPAEERPRRALRRQGTPVDVADLAHRLATDEARHASGELGVLDGGLTAQVQQTRG